MTKTKEEQKLAKKEYDKWYMSTDIGKMKKTIANWKYNGLIWSTDDEIEGIYTLYLGSTNCENPKCSKEYTTDNKKCMDHEHLNGKFGPFRNILCNSCNSKINSSNTSGINGIRWHKQSKSWRYQININGKKHSKCSKDKDWLLNYKLEFEKENLYIS